MTSTFDYNVSDGESLPLEFNRTETDDLNTVARINPDFEEKIIKEKINYTEPLMEELFYIFNGKIPRNFVLNIKGNIGRQTGIFKTSLALQLAYAIDPTFNIKERVGFTIYELLDKIKMFAKRKQIFMLDEKVRDLKQSAQMRLANIIDSCRESQICFILVGVTEENVTFSDYFLERLGESDDKHLPKKTIAYSVRKIMDHRKDYRGYIKWNVTPLEDKKWSVDWAEYMTYKSAHQRKAIEQNLTGFDITGGSKFIKEHAEYKDCLDENFKPIPKKLRNLIYKLFPDNTKDEREMIYVNIVPKSYFRTPKDKSADDEEVEEVKKEIRKLMDYDKECPEVLAIMEGKEIPR